LPSSPPSSYPRRRAAQPFFPPRHTATVTDLHLPQTTMTTTTTMMPCPPCCQPADPRVITISHHTPVTWPKGRRADTPRRRHHRFAGLVGKSSVEDRGCVVGKGRADRTMNLSRTSVGTRRTGPICPAHCPTGRQYPGPCQLLCHHCRPPLHREGTSFHPVWDSIVRYMPKNNFWKYPTF